MSLINLKIIIFISIFLSSCSTKTLNKYSDNSNSTQVKSNKFKSIENKINREKLKNLYVEKNPSQGVILNLKKKDISREFKIKKLMIRLTMHKKPFRQHLKCCQKHQQQEWNT